MWVKAVLVNDNNDLQRRFYVVGTSVVRMPAALSFRVAGDLLRTQKRGATASGREEEEPESHSGFYERVRLLTARAHGRGEAQKSPPSEACRP